MRFLHISDLHLGKMLHGVSLLENGDQPYWVLQFLALAEEVRPQAVVISGDVYDRSSPSGEAVSLLSQLVEGLAQRNIAVLMVAGNHDSGQRLSFARDMLAREHIHIAGTAQRGLQAGAYRFLEEYCNRKIYTQDIIVCPKNDRITVPADADVIYEPFFEYTDTDWNSPRNAEYSMANGLNGGQ